MPTLLASPTVIQAAGNKPKVIEEYAGCVNSGHAQVSVARMVSPEGWREPGQRPEFEEITVVLRGLLRVEHEGGVLDVRAGQGVVTGRQGSGFATAARKPAAPSMWRSACRPLHRTPCTATQRSDRRAYSRIDCAFRFHSRRRGAQPRACFLRPDVPKIVLAVGAACAVAPDLDVSGLTIGFGLDHPLGHRGFSHSIAFAVLLALVCAAGPATPRRTGRRGRPAVAYFFACTSSHGVLDALTNGGRGVAFLMPFSDQRYHFPVRPIEVSPLRRA